ncbi:hypothetical protein DSM07_10320 [Oenococcus sp. UCMA 16435]|nr:hypothetical protein DSM07_10320 [Oenococcus sp. UCMA 16435]
MNNPVIRKKFIDAYNTIRNKLINYDKENKLKKHVNDLLKDIKQIVKENTGVNPPPEINLSKIFIYQKEKDMISTFCNMVVNKEELRKENKGLFSLKVEKRPWKNASEFKDAHHISRSFPIKEDLID